MKTRFHFQTSETSIKMPVTLQALKTCNQARSFEECAEQYAQQAEVRTQVVDVKIPAIHIEGEVECSVAEIREL